MTKSEQIQSLINSHLDDQGLACYAEVTETIANIHYLTFKDVNGVTYEKLPELLKQTSTFHQLCIERDIVFSYSVSRDQVMAMFREDIEDILENETYREDI